MPPKRKNAGVHKKLAKDYVWPKNYGQPTKDDQASTSTHYKTPSVSSQQECEKSVGNMTSKGSFLVQSRCTEKKPEKTIGEDVLIDRDHVPSLHASHREERSCVTRSKASCSSKKSKIILQKQMVLEQQKAEYEIMRQQQELEHKKKMLKLEFELKKIELENTDNSSDENSEHSKNRRMYTPSKIGKWIELTPPNDFRKKK